LPAKSKLRAAKSGVWSWVPKRSIASVRAL
jgi:hypothetical protein